MISSNPSFAYLKPWYLSTFSISLLTSSTYSLEGSFSPGFCPGHIQNNIDGLFYIENKFEEFFGDSSVISYVENPISMNSFQNSYQNSEGFYNLRNQRNVEEAWFSTYKDYKGDIQLEKNDLSGKQVIITTLVLSFFGAFLIGLTGFMLFKVGVVAISKKILKNSHHASQYSKFAKEFENPSQKKNPTENNKNSLNLRELLKESSLINFFKTVPRISSFVSYYSIYMIKRYFINSVPEFCDHLLNPNFEDKYINQFKIGKINPIYIELKERELKNYYEQFCFLNNYPERSLNDSKTIKIFDFGH